MAYLGNNASLELTLVMRQNKFVAMRTVMIWVTEPVNRKAMPMNGMASFAQMRNSSS